MQFIVIKQEKIYKYPFPNKYLSNYWIKDNDEFGNTRDLIMAEKLDNSWVIVSNNICKIIENDVEVHQTPLALNKYYTLKIKNKDSTTDAIIYVCDENDYDYNAFKVINDSEIIIGSSPKANIIVTSSNFPEQQAIITRKNNKFSIKEIDDKFGVYVNNYRVKNYSLENGDIIFTIAYKIIILNDCLLVNSHYNISINTPNITPIDLPTYEGKLLETNNDDNAELYDENDYYSRSPRFVTSIVEEDFKIDSPPGQIKEDDTPIIYTIGPMITMSMSSVVSASVAIMNTLNGRGTMISIIPTAVMSVTMLLSTILWPTLMRKYNKKKRKKAENERQEKYIKYLTDKNNKIEQLKINQYQVLIENYPEPQKLEQIIVNKRRNLWERKREDNDFLNVRLGIGTIPLKIKLNYSSEDFSMSNDNLKEELNKIANNALEIQNAPVTISLTERNKLVIIGDKYYKESLIKSIIIQLATYHSYDELKLVLLTDDNNCNLWDKIKILPHMWSNSHNIRFYGNNADDISKLSFYLEQVYMSRKYDDSNGERQEQNLTYKNVTPYYLIIIDNIKKNRNVEIVSKILEDDNNIGFGLIILNDGIGNLPNECNDFITAAGEKSAIIKNDLNKNNQQTFIMDNTDELDIPMLCEKLSNIPIKMPTVLDDLKATVGFLEMYKVGKIENLNILERWTKNNPVNSLSVPIGIHSDGEIFNLDLHEKFHGPHGLVAGMTGSGKSEFIITYILSMCINFNPEEVSFVLIDYKGGGLTGAFENSVTGIKLPHLAGTITNLDTAEIKRSLSSIDSELKRRQELFNRAKLELNESTIDIYKYQKLYRDGKISTPISHLFIISDEFAELKSQQPEFMNELISAARIGRSLGVHLILCTQKPSGIVDDQIWSNSKFKVCLKVQEKSDSMDVIKCADAAALKQVGRFYLQVGYNDYFALGQSAYSGVKYIPRDKITKTVDRNISFIDNIGDTIRSIESSKEVEVASYGEELPNILNYIYDMAKSQKIFARKLWLDKIPSEIFVNELMQKYAYKPIKWDIKPIIGEYDDPSHQMQHLLTLDYNNSPNTLIYGADDKEIMLSSIIYSLIITHGPEEINIYIMDFGTEIFGMFKKAPQVGDIIYVNDSEKLTNLFNTLRTEIEKRKKLFVDYNGDYNLYIRTSDKKIPRYIIIINNYEIFNESYEEYIDIVSSLTREGERYGISFIITATGVNAVRGKITQNFSNQLCLQFNDPTDYASILGPTHGMIPSNIIGRGLIKLDNVIYEYQTAYPCKWSEANTFIRNICDKLDNVIKMQAKTIAILPEHVRFDNISNKVQTLKNVPVGIEKNTLNISTFDFDKNKISLVSSQDNSALGKFALSLAQVIQKIQGVKVYMFDTDDNTEKGDTIINYYKNDYKELVEKLNPSKESSEINVVILMGIDNYKNSLSAEEQNRVNEALNNAKNNPNLRIILVDDINKIKNIEYESFYRENVQAANAIWIGSGITEQFTIKCSTYNKETRSQIQNEFGYNINKGTATLIKMLDFYTID